MHYKTILGLRVSALLEIAVFFALAFLLEVMLGASPRFEDTSPHPYWIIVVLIAAQYGSNEGLLAVLCATLALLLFNLPQQQIGQDFYGWIYHIAIRPIMWLVAAVVLGELRLRHIRERDDLRKELQESHTRESSFATHYEQAKARKEKLELNIAGQLRSETAAFRAAKAIERLQPEDVIQGVRDLVVSALGPEKFSFYLLKGDVLERHMTHGHDDDGHVSYDAQFRSHTQLYQSVVSRNETLSVVNNEHERILSGQGILAGPLVNTDTGDVLGMLKVEDMPFLELNLTTVQTFRALCEWIAMAIVNANYYQSAMDESTINPQHNLMTRSFFARYRDYITALAARLKFNVYMLTISVANSDALDASARIDVARSVSNAVKHTLRTVDFAFDHQQSSGDYAIILPATDAKGANVVRDKIEKALQKQKATRAQFSFSLQPLHEAA